MSIDRYEFQWPNMNIPPYCPRYISPGLLSKKAAFYVDWTRGNVVTPCGAKPYLKALWMSMAINVNNKFGIPDTILFSADERHFINYMLDKEDSAHLAQLYIAEQYLNSFLFDKGVRVILMKISSWEDLQVVLADNLTVFTGFTVYRSFLQAEHTGVVPMVRPKDDLLGSHCMVLTGYNPEESYLTALSTVVQFGANMTLRIPDSFIRNLSICRDFYVLYPEKLYA